MATMTSKNVKAQTMRSAKKLAAAKAKAQAKAQAKAKKEADKIVEAERKKAAKAEAKAIKSVKKLGFKVGKQAAKKAAKVLATKNKIIAAIVKKNDSRTDGGSLYMDNINTSWSVEDLRQVLKSLSLSIKANKAANAWKKKVAAKEAKQRKKWLAKIDAQNYGIQFDRENSSIETLKKICKEIPKCKAADKKLDKQLAKAEQQLVAQREKAQKKIDAKATKAVETLEKKLDSLMKWCGNNDVPMEDVIAMLKVKM